jgi:hypothetical protein
MTLHFSKCNAVVSSSSLCTDGVPNEGTVHVKTKKRGSFLKRFRNQTVPETSEPNAVPAKDIWYSMDHGEWFDANAVGNIVAKDDSSRFLESMSAITTSGVAVRPLSEHRESVFMCLHTFGRHKTRQDKIMQGKARQRQSKIGQEEIRQHTNRQDTTRQSKARQGNARQDKTRRGTARKDKIRCDNSRQDKRRLDKTILN